ncbi:L-fuculose-phosphate aldolase/L-ribulose-5-phosphate 4-epimerase [Anaerosolibacter carboniphilus]|uniref:L-fuculose-phosphate aldolase/L-ribulose-5-phosphate 4-epimerase n=1 Tax=Anaerosolibacter carboniphilus TaxID=1417629 RepID=A0A841KVM2_9FIRM|nr:L-ribulose-5-phosphate 4-epimerase [Anaerosolibacter carboniphilus]MBB6217417.1 L-fuculose-phosphate aldolase/L-ribulose-5-phosphate 4-epimerase [Anaerosolibacter carboniphilus]
MLLEKLRIEVIEAGKQLKEYGLITLTGGNVSGRDEETGLVAITPSGMEYHALAPQDIVIIDLYGNIQDGKRKPSSDMITHLQIYRAIKRINGIIHTHSTYASCFAILNENIPVVSTTMANEVGGEVPVASYGPVGSEELGEHVIHNIKNQQAVLLQSHGVLTFGADVHHALKAAVMLEDAAKVYYLARTIGKPQSLSEEEIKRANDLYQNVYGQRSE